METPPFERPTLQNVSIKRFKSFTNSPDPFKYFSEAVQLSLPLVEVIQPLIDYLDDFVELRNVADCLVGSLSGDASLRFRVLPVRLESLAYSSEEDLQHLKDDLRVALLHLAAAGYVARTHKTET